MIRARENPFVLQAGALSVLVHGLFFVLLVMTFSWKNVPTMQVAQVELWDSLPQPKVVTPEPKLEPPPPPKIEPQPEPPPPSEPKAEIQIKAKPPAPEVKRPPKEEPKKPDPALKAKEEEKKRKEALRKLQEDLLKDDQPVDRVVQQAETQKAEEAKAATEAKRAAETLSASSGVINDYRAKIQAKIKRFVNRQVCGSGKPELVFAISLMPTGEISGNPRLTKGSGISACDQAVERAILQAQPLPLPPQPELFAQFRDLDLKFRPNDDQ